MSNGAVLSPSTGDSSVEPSLVLTPMNSPLAQRPDVSGFRATACIDWIEVDFTMSRVTTVYWLHARFGGDSYVQSLGSPRRGSGTRFRARIQNPQDADSVLSLLKGVGAAAIRVTGIEVATDFYPKTADARAAMPMLAAHLLRGLKNPQDFARFGWRGPGCEQIISFADAHRGFAQGKCCYLGHKRDLHQQRIYVKRTDGGGKALEPAQHRVRIENTYFERQGLAAVWGDGLKQIIGRDDFAFRRLSDQLDGLQQLLACRAVQVGARTPRCGRVFYARNTKADIELNRNVADALRSLIKRWAVDELAAEIADRTSSAIEGSSPASNNYNSINAYLLSLTETAIPVAVSTSAWVMMCFWGDERRGMLLPASSPLSLGPITKWEIAMTVPVLRMLLLSPALGHRSAQLVSRLVALDVPATQGRARVSSRCWVQREGVCVYRPGGTPLAPELQSHCKRAMRSFNARRGSRNELKNVEQGNCDSHRAPHSCVGIIMMKPLASLFAMDRGSLRKRREQRTGGRQFVSTPWQKAWISMSNVVSHRGRRSTSTW